MLYAFAILAAPSLTIKPAGILRDAVEYKQVEELIAVVEPDLDVQALQQVSEEALTMAVIRHDRVVCELFAQCAVLPLRFGTAFISEAALQDYLRSHQQILITRLQNLAGNAEYLLKGKFTLPKLPTQTDLKGRDYLLAKRSQYEQQQVVRSQQQQEYQELAELIQGFQKVQLGSAQDSEDFRAYLLLDDTQAQSLQQLLGEWQNQHQSWQLDLSGALPPYHFAELV